MTIFGFNTDVKLGDAVYHVQSEARQNDLLLQTLVFVRGQCVGKRTVSYAHKMPEPGFSQEATHELLKSQHKRMIEEIQQGKIESALGPEAEIQDAGGSGLSLKCVHSEAATAAPAIAMSFHVSDSGREVAGANLASRSGCSADSPAIARAVTDALGNAGMRIPLTDEMRRESAVIVQVTSGDKSATRKFRFKKA